MKKISNTIQYNLHPDGDLSGELVDICDSIGSEGGIVKINADMDGIKITRSYPGKNIKQNFLNILSKYIKDENIKDMRYFRITPTKLSLSLFKYKWTEPEAPPKEQKVIKDLNQIQKDYTKRLNEAKDLYQMEISKRDKEISEKNKTLSDSLIRVESYIAIKEEKGVLELLMPLLREKCVVHKVGDKYVVVIDGQSDGKGGLLTVHDYVKSLKQDENFSRAFN